MTELDREKRMDRAAERFVSAVEEFARQVERLGANRARPLPEAEAARLADEAVHEVRSEMRADEARELERPALTPEEVRRWEIDREERRERERGRNRGRQGP